MPNSWRLILYVLVESFRGLTQLQPESGWENPLLRYEVAVHCPKCNIQLQERYHLPMYLSAGGSMTEGRDGQEYHKPLTLSTNLCPMCMDCGGLRILKRGGEPITVEGQEMPVMHVEVVGNFAVHRNIQSFNFRWICRKDDGSGEPVRPFYVKEDGSYEFWDAGNGSDEGNQLFQITGLKGYFNPETWKEEVEGLWLEEASRLPQSDSESNSEDSDD